MEALSHMRFFLPENSSLCGKKKNPTGTHDIIQNKMLKSNERIISREKNQISERDSYERMCRGVHVHGRTGEGGLLAEEIWGITKQNFYEHSFITIHAKSSQLHTEKPGSYCTRERWEKSVCDSLSATLVSVSAGLVEGSELNCHQREEQRSTDILGLQDGSKALAMQTWLPEFNPQNLHKGTKGEPTPQDWPLT